MSVCTFFASSILSFKGCSGCGIAHTNTRSNKKFAAGSLPLNRDAELVIRLRPLRYRRIPMNAAERFGELRERDFAIDDFQRRTAPTAIIPDQIKRYIHRRYSIISRLIARVVCFQQLATPQIRACEIIVNAADGNASSSGEFVARLCIILGYSKQQ